jgi:hypothetical protein
LARASRQKPKRVHDNRKRQSRLVCARHPKTAPSAPLNCCGFQHRKLTWHRAHAVPQWRVRNRRALCPNRGAAGSELCLTLRHRIGVRRLVSVKSGRRWGSKVPDSRALVLEKCGGCNCLGECCDADGQMPSRGVQGLPKQARTPAFDCGHARYRSPASKTEIPQSVVEIRADATYTGCFGSSPPARCMRALPAGGGQEATGRASTSTVAGLGNVRTWTQPYRRYAPGAESESSREARVTSMAQKCQTPRARPVRGAPHWRL